ncbi:hypothetical protein ES703_60605 [subsurface metagenome]
MKANDKKILDKAADDVVRRVLTIAESINLDRPTVDSTDFALLIIRYGSFLDEGFFKLLRNTSFAYALGTSLLAGLMTGTILNIMSLWGGG